MANTFALARTQLYDSAGNMARAFILFFQDLIAGAVKLIHPGAVPMVGTPGALVESAIKDDGTTVSVTGRATTLGGTLTVSGNTKVNALAGIGGAGAALYPLDIRLAATTPGLHMCNTDTDAGAYLVPGTNNTFLAHGAAFDGTNWIAKNAAATILEFGSVGIIIFSNTGLTPGSSYTPTQVFSITTSGGVVAAGDVTGNSITLSSRVTHGAPLTGTANLGTGAVTGTVT